MVLIRLANGPGLMEIITALPRVTISMKTGICLQTHPKLDTPTEPIYSGPAYTNTYRGRIGTADQIFNNFPEQGIELDAFYENTGFQYEKNGKIGGFHGLTDKAFGIPDGNYMKTYH